MKTILVGLLVLVSSLKLSAQNIFPLSETFRNKSGEIIYARLTNDDVPSTTVNDIGVIEDIFGKAPGITFKFLREFKTSDGHINKLYQQYSEGLVVQGSAFSLHTRAGKVESLSGNYGKNLPSAAISKLGLNDAYTAAIGFARLRKPKNEALTEGYEMVYSKNEIKQGEQYMLAYKVKISSGDKSNYNYYYIDAITGELLNIGYSICTGKINAPGSGTGKTNAPGSGASLYSGTLNFTGDDFNTGLLFRLREVRVGVNIHTLNDNHSTNTTGATATDFTDNDNNWTAAEHPDDRAALDAHWGAERVFDYWLNVRNRNSLNDAGIDMIGYVHHGTDFNNGFWLDAALAVFYGDGNAEGGTVTSLDWCAHEFGHGVCHFTSGQSNDNSESGALNEGFSDIWGACVEADAAPQKQRWLIFEETTLVSPFHERNMANPADGHHPQPDTYNGPHWGDLSSDPHINSGVLNHWFYLLSEGGSGTNGIGNPFSLTGIGMADAAWIAYETEQNIPIAATYQNARTQSIVAARAHFGVGSCQEIAVTRAWFAVGVGANYAAPPVINATISGPSPMCSSPTTYTISGVPAGYTVSWSTSAPSIATVPPNSTGNSVDVTKVSNGNFFLIATLTSAAVPCNTYIPPITKLIVAGPYPNYGISVSGPYMVPLNYTTNFSINLTTYPGITNINWSWPAGWSCLTGCTNSSYVVLRSPSSASTGNITASYTACGQGGILATKWVAWGYGGPTYRVYPNPANSVIQIEELNNTSDKVVVETNIREVEIIDKMGVTVYRKQIFKGNGGRVMIPVARLKSDIYTVRIFDGKEWKNYKIIIQH